MRRVFIFLFFNFFCLSSYADSLNNDELKNIEATCQQSSPQCLAYLEIGLNGSQPHSRQWFRFKQLRLFNLFDLQKLPQLKQEVNYWLFADNMPPNFAVYVYIYHAKLSSADGLSNESTTYLNKATNLLNDINIKSFSPLRLIEIANLQISLKSYSQAKQTLLQLEEKFSQRDYPNFKKELYANLGHISWHQKDHKQHVFYRIKSLEWSLKTPNKQQIAVAYNNLAFAYKNDKQYNKAEISYLQSIKYAKLALDDRTLESTSLNLIKVLLLQKKLTQARDTFEKLSESFVEDIQLKRNKKLYEKLKVQLAK